MIKAEPVWAPLFIFKKNFLERFLELVEFFQELVVGLG